MRLVILLTWKLNDLSIGLEQGIQGMCTGEIRRLTVPTSLHVCKFFFFVRNHMTQCTHNIYHSE